MAVEDFIVKATVLISFFPAYFIFFLLHVWFQHLLNRSPMLKFVNKLNDFLIIAKATQGTYLVTSSADRLLKLTYKLGVDVTFGIIIS